MELLERQSLLQIAKQAALEAGALLKKSQASVIKDFEKDIKLDADIQAHTCILKILESSKIPILSEEDESLVFSNSLQWVIDPLDGSLNFLRGIPNCAISIGLMDGRRPILGFVYDFIREEMYTGIVGQGAQLNDKVINVSKVSKRRDAILMTGFPARTSYAKDALENYVTAVQNFKRVRLIGSAALSLAYVASGRVDAYYERDIYIWDVCGGLAVLLAAGGNYSETEMDKDGRLTISAENGNKDGEYLGISISN